MNERKNRKNFMPRRGHLWCCKHATLKSMRSRPPSRSESDNRSPRVRSGARPSESHQRGSQFRRAPQPLQTDSLAWAIKTAADCVTEVIAFGRSLTVVLAKLRLQQLPANAVRAQAIDLT